MNFDKFCEKRLILTRDFSTPIELINITKHIYSDIRLFKEVQQLLEENSENRNFDICLFKDVKKLLEENSNNGIGNEEILKSYFDKTLENLIDLFPTKYYKIVYKKQTRVSTKFFNKHQAKKDCWTLFLTLWKKNKKMCFHLFPIIAFILVDSYTEIKNHNGLYDSDWLYAYIKDILNGKYQDRYLFSMLWANTSDKESCIQMGGHVFERMILNLPFTDSADYTPRSDHLDEDNVNHTYAENNNVYYPATNFRKLSMRLSFEDTCIRKYVDRPETFFHYLVNELSDFLYEKCNIRKHFTGIKSDRSCQVLMENEDENKKKEYYPRPALLGENFVVLYSYIKKLRSCKENIFSNFNKPLTIYTLSQMTQWVLPFITDAQNTFLPVYNSRLLLTSYYFNTEIYPDIAAFDPQCRINAFYSFCFNERHTKHPQRKICNGFNTSIYFDDTKSFNKKLNKHFPILPDSEDQSSVCEDENKLYVDKIYNVFMEWYSSSSPDEKSSFDSFLNERSIAIFNFFMDRTLDYLFIPTPTQIHDPYEHHLGLFYCFMDRFYDHIIGDFKKILIDKKML